MTLVNSFNDTKVVSKKDYRVLLELLNPFSPHITEELNEKYNLGGELCYSSWPKYDEEKTIDDEVEVVVQINGKVRGKVTVPSDISEDDIKGKVREIENVKKYLEGSTIVKEIYIPKKLVSIVIK